MNDKKQLQVNAIKEGTVIDHIPAKNLFKVISILGLDKIDTPITFGTNLESKRLGCKAIVKIADLFFRDEDINKISLVAPDAKFNIIKDYEVVEKKVVDVPDNIIGITKCYNPMCITNNEPVITKFAVLSKKTVTLKCHYCEKVMGQEDFVIM